jgi:transcriptional regulator with XRE-family HTH domain
MSEVSVVAKRLKEARIRAGISQKQLGIQAGIDDFSASPRINQYERGKHEPDLRTLTRLASVLDVPVAYFYCDDADLAQVILRFARLRRADRKRVLALLPE